MSKLYWTILLQLPILSQSVNTFVESCCLYWTLFLFFLENGNFGSPQLASRQPSCDSGVVFPSSSSSLQLSISACSNPVYSAHSSVSQHQSGYTLAQYVTTQADTREHPLWQRSISSGLIKNGHDKVFYLSMAYLSAKTIILFSVRSSELNILGTRSAMKWHYFSGSLQMIIL